MSITIETYVGFAPGFSLNEVFICPFGVSLSAYRDIYPDGLTSNLEIMREALFDSRERTDASYIRHNEDLFSFLDRVDDGGFSGVRDLLNIWFSELPTAKATSLRADANSRRDAQIEGAMWELFLHAAAHVARTERGKTTAPLEMVFALGAALHVPPVHFCSSLSVTANRSRSRPRSPSTRRPHEPGSAGEESCQGRTGGISGRTYPKRNGESTSPRPTTPRTYCHSWWPAGSTKTQSQRELRPQTNRQRENETGRDTMASAWIARRENTRGVTYRVLYRLGGRESSPTHAGSFPTQREARIRRDWVAGELAAMRVPDLRLIQPAPTVALRDVAERWRASRVDVSEGTAATHRVNLGRILPTLGERPIDAITAEDVADLVVRLSSSSEDGEGLKRESIRKTVATLAMVFDHHGVTPNPARDRRVRLPQEDRIEVNPPTAGHVETVYAIVPAAFKLPLLVLEATGMRVGELEALTWGDVDETEGRWRVTTASAKTSRARWVPVPEIVFDAVTRTVPREDRDLTDQVFAGFGADRFRTTLTRACKAGGVPAFSPHDLRHRRATLWHLSGVPAIEAASWLGHSAQEHLRTYAHVVIDRTELDYAPVLGARRARISA